MLFWYQQKVCGGLWGDISDHKNILIFKYLYDWNFIFGEFMGLPVRIDSDLYDQAKSHAHAERRTISGQIEFWAMIGKAALDNPDLPIDFVRDLMIAKG